MSSSARTANSMLDDQRIARPRRKVTVTLWQVFVICLIGLAIHFAAIAWIVFSGFIGQIDYVHAAIFIIGAIFVCSLAILGWTMLHIVRRELKDITDDATRMRQFIFDPSPPAAPFVIGDLRDVKESLEAGKLAIRSIRKYVPLPLLQQLYHERKEADLFAERLHYCLVIFVTLQRCLKAYPATPWRTQWVCTLR